MLFEITITSHSITLSRAILEVSSVLAVHGADFSVYIWMSASSRMYYLAAVIANGDAWGEEPSIELAISYQEEEHTLTPKGDAGELHPFPDETK